MSGLTTLTDIEQYQLLLLRKRMSLELLGMTHSGGSTMALINRKFGTAFKRKQVALEYINEKIKGYQS